MNIFNMAWTDKLTGIVGFLYKTLFFTFFILAAIKLIVNDGSWINYFIIFVLGVFTHLISRIIIKNIRSR